MQRYRTFQRSNFKFKTCRYLAKHCPFACPELFERSLALQLYGTYYMSHKVETIERSINSKNIQLSIQMSSVDRLLKRSPIKLQRHRSFQRSKFTFKTCRHVRFVVYLHAGSFSNAHLRCNFMGLTIACPLNLKYIQVSKIIRQTSKVKFRTIKKPSKLKQTFQNRKT